MKMKYHKITRSRDGVTKDVCSMEAKMAYHLAWSSAYGLRDRYRHECMNADEETRAAFISNAIERCMEAWKHDYRRCDGISDEGIRECLTKGIEDYFKYPERYLQTHEEIGKLFQAA